MTPGFLAALRAGAIGYVRKEAEPEVLLAAVRAAARRQSSLDPALAQTVVQELAPAPAVARPHHSRAATSRAARKPLAMA